MADRDAAAMMAALKEVYAHGWSGTERHAFERGWHASHKTTEQPDMVQLRRDLERLADDLDVAAGRTETEDVANRRQYIEFADRLRSAWRDAWQSEGDESEQ